MKYLKIRLPFNFKKKTLALGSQTKNTLCFIKGNTAYITKEARNLEKPEHLEAFKKDCSAFLKEKPDIIAYDLHPEYTTTKFLHQLEAGSWKLEAVQHHHAHVASCMLENNLKNIPVIGVAFDGTGFGTDKTFWGGEFLVCDYNKFKRCAHLKAIPLFGGEKTVIEPWRVASFWLYSLFNDKFLNLESKFSKKIDRNKWKSIKDVYLEGFQFPYSSSMGRLFDALSSIILAKTKAAFEAELPIALEKLANTCSQKPKSLGFTIQKEENEYIINPKDMVRKIVKLSKIRETKALALDVHFTIALMISKTCKLIAKKHKINTVVLSGGVFQNKILHNLALGLLYNQGFNVITHKILPPSDESLSLGQAIIASFRKR